MVNLSPADHKIGAISTFLVLALPEYLPYLGKFAFAVATAAACAFVSAVVKNKVRKKD